MTVVGWEEVAQKKRADNLNKIPEEWILETIPSVEEAPDVNPFLDSILTEREVYITTKLSGVQIIDAIAKGDLRSYEVCLAFCHRAALTHQLTNCLSEIFFDKALERAQHLDSYQDSHDGKTLGPLHGLPISLKDQINLKGIDTSIGYVAPLMSKELQNLICHKDCDNTEESLIAQILYDSGCVFYVKTTVPMAMLGAETVSNLFGDTPNSLNRKLTSGGSSGGEGSLIGAHGSLVGIGTDIGGSIRNPTLYHGLYGLRASSNRFPYLNISNSYPDQTVIPSVVGPMARHLEDLELVTKIIFNYKSWLYDAKAVPLPYRENQLSNTKPLKIGFFKWDGVIMPHPPILRGIETLCKSLADNGHQTLDLGLPPASHAELAKLLVEFYKCDGLVEVKEFCKLSGEPLSALIQRSLSPQTEPLSIDQYMRITNKKYKYQQTYDKFWNSTKEMTYDQEPIDAFLIAGGASTSWIIGDNMKVGHCYTRFINVLDYVSITIPVTKVDKLKDLPLENYNAVSESDKAAQDYYDPELYDKMPVTLQLVCRRYEEEKAIEIAKIITEILNK